MHLLRQTITLARNDLRQEARRLELVLTAGFFTLVVVVMFALSFFNLDAEVQRKAIPGMVWLCIAFVGALTLSRVFEREREANTLTALLAAPVDRLAIYLSKLIVTVLILLMCSALLVPGLGLLFPSAEVFAADPLALAVLMALGCLGYAAIGTLFAAGLANGSGKNVLLSVILYPLTTPILLFALVATQRLLEGHRELWATLGQLAALDVALIGVGCWLFEVVLVGAAGPSEGAQARRVRARSSSTAS
ncbi:heme exporter protein CcmB [Pseudenhygromyxa sp. WMMC2535]|uniref:heme exporter protein CcmB n=1 Tax=Pseudenhygromyxa sp. WMMC2535 TaxID=2712867 RepID=UPI001555B0C3|nr:heme exporter protein CcmB [Pseudenhygromyxa sp. WMMC2535]NVB36509.1 heme exporter protein CcmB [Pseudenhygromyxa sp. WMMC2535]